MQASSYLKFLDICKPTTHHIEAPCIVTYIELFQMTVKTKAIANRVLATLIKLVSTTYINVKVMPTNDTNYSCHIKTLELV